MVESFCEGPTYLNCGDGKCPVHFWVRDEDREVLLVLNSDAENQVSTVTINDAELTVRNVLAVELATARVWIGNWERMLPLVISCRHEISSSLRNSIRKFITESVPLSRIEQEFVTGDPTNKWSI